MIQESVGKKIFASADVEYEKMVKVFIQGGVKRPT